ncbi:MAG: hypothetical protein DRQ64_00155 [Gammaproteobacteria bacterium]|nr:MAG: hypothetical protein DRQ64_00155 [Gammaproteobacteria bacterium]
MTTTPVTAPEYQQSENWLGSPFLHIKRVIVKFLQGLHAQCPPGAYQWCPAQNTSPDHFKASEIWIGSETPLNPDVIGQRPAITVLRGPGMFQGVGLGDQAFHDLRTGAKVLMDMLPVTVTVNVLSRIPAEAEGIAWFAAKHIWALREEIMRGEEGIMFLGSRLNISPPSPAGSLVGPDTEHNWVVCSVSIPCYLQTSVTRMPLNTGVVQSIAVKMTTQDSRTLPPGGEDERQSTEPLEARLIVDKETT